MRLYKMELYKICHKRIFIVGAVCVAVIMLLFLWPDERSTVDGITYTGYKAIQKDREITEKYKGVLTDEKAAQILEEYGFPSKVEPGWGFFRDANFLNAFIFDYLSDGYINDWNDYKTASRIYPIANTELGKARTACGREIELAYCKGWGVFLETMSVGMVLGCILVLFGISTIFAGEGQVKMLSLLFTASEGKEKDVRAKIAAAFTVAFFIWAGIYLLDLLVCGAVYGWDGLGCYSGIVLANGLYVPEMWLPIWYYVLTAAALSFFGILTLCAVTICISAYFKSSFHAVVTAAVCYGAPVLLAMFIENSSTAQFLSIAPVFMASYNYIEDIYDIWLIPVGIAAVAAIYCVCTAYRKYRGQQVL
ncbi:MAG: ABC transporter permease subunit [Roseburia sp.]|nr:ABC transporter permease subunit [Roseburia sp.]MCM1241219.1 ABC transporter permease subunit [Roseburia sp.]